MPSRCVTYRILERADGLFNLEVTSATGFIVQREGFTSLTEADLALRDLRAALATCR